MSGMCAISTTSRRELSSRFFLFLQGKAPKEIHAILTETLACFLPGRAKDLSAPLYIGLLVNMSQRSRVPASSSRFVFCRISISLITHRFLFSNTPTTLQRTSIFTFEDGTDTQTRNVDNKPRCAAQRPTRAKISNTHFYNTSAESLLPFFLV